MKNITGMTGFAMALAMGGLVRASVRHDGVQDTELVRNQRERELEMIREARQRADAERKAREALTVAAAAERRQRRQAKRVEIMHRHRKGRAL